MKQKDGKWSHQNIRVFVWNNEQPHILIKGLVQNSNKQLPFSSHNVTIASSALAENVSFVEVLSAETKGCI